ncbi:phage tail protein [Pseudorhodobacter sp. E13]|uniref:NlpC/P60 family protein n=1 Tax=Pseudorhodobacter sp. E13 TaxID=2487931 RepID=UPI000F8F7027|nr:NlpC/P60 family protein [Pseudorhodobacter sp. E13]RUS64865.1 phage tail protein [Pseudorhodobacter sp. E13]
MSAWANAFVGIPFAPFGRDRLGADCWGLACIVYAEARGITLPAYLGYGGVDEHAEIDALIAGAEGSPLWLCRTGEARPFDIAVFRRGRLATHLGIVIRPGMMLHMVDEDRAKIETYGTGRWGNRLVGHFHWAGA